ncbi:MAG: ComEC/Rec2 family competence protein [Treponema sp.]|nr:ComEC/Rec2 family competence protein [Treponema sp.]
MVVNTAYTRNPLVYTTLICIICIYGGFFTLPHYNSLHTVIPCDKIVSLTGTVCDSPVLIRSANKKNSLYRLSMQVETTKGIDGMYCSASGIIPVFCKASDIEALYPGKLYTASHVQNPAACIVDQGCHLQVSGQFKNDAFYVTSYQSTGMTHGYTNTFSHIRALSRLYVKRILYSWGNAGGLLLACIQGSREYIDTSLSDAFTKAGLSHILALSGMHLMLFGSMAGFFGKKINRITGICFTVLVMLLFTWFAGITPSLLRACIFALLGITLSCLGFSRPSMLLLLALTFLIHLYLKPEHAVQLSFLLSYVSLAGIFLFGTLCQRYVIRYIPPVFADALSTSMAAQIGSCPVTLFFFKTVAPFGAIASCIVAPLLILFLYAGIFGVGMCYMFPKIAPIVTGIVQGIYMLLSHIVIFFSRIHL